MVVTHLPQVASHADHHFRVEKRQAEERTLTRVACLDSATRVEEVARMLDAKGLEPVWKDWDRAFSES